MPWLPGSGDLGVVFDDCLGVIDGGDHGVPCLRFGRLFLLFFWATLVAPYVAA